MFQRIKGAIDRTIAEEQARLKSPDSTTGTPTSSSGAPSQRTDASTGNRTRGSKPSADLTDALANPDPAVFEAAFVLDDSDEPSRAATPNPAVDKERYERNMASKDLPAGNPSGRASAKTDEQAEKTSASSDAISDRAPTTAQATSSPGSNLSLETKQRLRKLDKLEATYPELLRSYRVAHRRATAIEPFEKALRENTPLTSIGDPSALVEYLNQLTLRGDMVMDELKSVSAEKDALQKKSQATDEILVNLRKELEALRSTRPIEPSTQGSAPNISTGNKTSKSSTINSAATSEPQSGDAANARSSDNDAAEDFFSYDDEIPNLQADLSSKSEKIEELKLEVESLATELSSVKERRSDLEQKLESATRKLDESHDAVAAHATLQTQSDAQANTILTLKEQLAIAQSRLKEAEAGMEEDKNKNAAQFRKVELSLAAAGDRVSVLDAEVSKAANAKLISNALISELNSQVEKLKQEKDEASIRLGELSKKLELQDSPRGVSTDAAPSAQQVDAAPGASSKKKNNKKKKGKGAGTSVSAIQLAEDKAKQELEQVEDSPQQASDGARLTSEVIRLEKEVAEKDAQIDRLLKKRKTEEDLREEIETLQGDLIHIGQDHVEAKERVKTLEKEKVELKSRIAELEEKISSSAMDPKLQGNFDKLQQEYDAMQNKSATLRSDLEAAQLLAQSRFRELTDLKEVIQKVQPELKTLRLDSATLKSTKEELATRLTDLKDKERREKELHRELEKALRLSSNHEAEVKTLRDRLSTESNIKQKSEEAQRLSVRELRRTEAEKIEISARAEKLGRELQRAQDESSKIRPRIKELEEQMHQLRREKNASDEEAEFKVQQYTTAQGLLTSMRDETAEVSIQLKEAKSQADSLEEELAEVQRLLQERTREGETMRRLLADVDERSDSKVRDMRGRMEAAIEERERLEDESSTLARRRAREVEDLKQKIRELERESKTLKHERDELEELERGWKRRREEVEAVESKAQTETEEMRTTVAQLRSALDASENQVRNGEKQRADLRKMLDDSRQRYDKVAKDLKGTQAKLVASSGRSSMDSNRSGINGGPTTDTAYLKTILLQFLEQKDGRLRSQLVPVLGKLLKFDKADEQKWASAVQKIEVR